MQVSLLLAADAVATTHFYFLRASIPFIAVADLPRIVASVTLNLTLTAISSDSRHHLNTSVIPTTFF